MRTPCSLHAHAVNRARARLPASIHNVNMREYRDIRHFSRRLYQQLIRCLRRELNQNILGTGKRRNPA